MRKQYVLSIILLLGMLTLFIGQGMAADMNSQSNITNEDTTMTVNYQPMVTLYGQEQTDTDHMWICTMIAVMELELDNITEMYAEVQAAMLLNGMTVYNQSEYVDSYAMGPNMVYLYPEIEAVLEKGECAIFLTGLVNDTEGNHSAPLTFTDILGHDYYENVGNGGTSLLTIIRNDLTSTTEEEEVIHNKTVVKYVNIVIDFIEAYGLWLVIIVGIGAGIGIFVVYRKR